MKNIEADGKAQAIKSGTLGGPGQGGALGGAGIEFPVLAKGAVAGERLQDRTRETFGLMRFPADAVDLDDSGEPPGCLGIAPTLGNLEDLGRPPLGHAQNAEGPAPALDTRPRFEGFPGLFQEGVPGTQEEAPP